MPSDEDDVEKKEWKKEETDEDKWGLVIKPTTGRTWKGS